MDEISDAAEQERKIGRLHAAGVLDDEQAEEARARIRGERPTRFPAALVAGLLSVIVLLLVILIVGRFDGEGDPDDKFGGVDEGFDSEREYCLNLVIETSLQSPLTVSRVMLDQYGLQRNVGGYALDIHNYAVYNGVNAARTWGRGRAGEICDLALHLEPTVPDDLEVEVSPVSSNDVESEASEQFSALGPVDAVDCPTDLPAEVGASIICTLESEGTLFEMTATVTSVVGDTANFDMEITDEL